MFFAHEIHANIIARVLAQLSSKASLGADPGKLINPGGGHGIAGLGADPGTN